MDAKVIARIYRKTHYDYLYEIGGYAISLKESASRASYRYNIMSSFTGETIFLGRYADDILETFTALKYLCSEYLDCGTDRISKVYAPEKRIASPTPRFVDYGENTYRDKGYGIGADIYGF